MLGTALTFLAGLVGSVGPFALAGGPLGLAVAWLGSTFANKTAKWIAIAGGLLLLVAASVGVTVYIEHLKRDREAYLDLVARYSGTAKVYGCDRRANVAEHDLITCLTARNAEAEKARADRIADLQEQAAKAQADLAVAAGKLDAANAALGTFIDQAARGGDGPVPKVLRDLWARQRKERGQ